jgi:methylenetetrahydromethanopterin dehydrogenase
VVAKLVVKVLFLKIGFLGTTPLIEALLDERANRKDISLRVVSSGVKLKEEDARMVLRSLPDEKFDLIVMVAPNAGVSGPALAWRELSKKHEAIVVVSDSPVKKMVGELDGKGVGYILIEADSMLGARKEFLDSVEMSLFNSDIIKVLAVTGVFRRIQNELDRLIRDLGAGKRLVMPRVVLSKDTVLTDGGFSNPYALAKAVASFEIATRVGALSVEGLYKVKERERYLPIVAAGHEMMRHAALLADEAREIEKADDTVLRTVHLDDGKSASKVRLMDTLK